MAGKPNDMRGMIAFALLMIVGLVIGYFLKRVGIGLLIGLALGLLGSGLLRKRS